MNLLTTPEQDQIVEAIRDALNGMFPLERLNEYTAGTIIDWQVIAELGWLGLGMSEEQGGVGYGLPEEMLLFREFGRFVLPPSLMATVVVAQLAAQQEDFDLRDALLTGQSHCGLAVPADDGPYYLLDAESAPDVLVFNEAGLALIASDQFGKTDVIPGMDTSVPLATAALQISDFDDSLLNRYKLLLAAQMTGLSEGARDMAVEYAGIREQFGKPIGAFQAVKHHCADMAVRSEAARFQTVYAALALQDEHDDASQQVEAALHVASEAAIENGQMNIQIHGAMGFSAECRAHHYVKRAQLLSRLHGRRQQHLEAIL